MTFLSKISQLGKFIRTLHYVLVGNFEHTRQFMPGRWNNCALRAGRLRHILRGFIAKTQNK